MASGIKVDESCIEAYADLKLKKEKGNRPFAISFKIAENDTRIVLDERFERPGGDFSPDWQEEAFAELVKRLPEKDGRYVVVDMRVAADAGEAKTDKIGMIVWASDAASVKRKMLYSSSLLSFKDKMNIKDHIQANDKSDLTYKEITSKLSKKK